MALVFAACSFSTPPRRASRFPTRFSKSFFGERAVKVLAQVTCCVGFGGAAAGGAAACVGRTVSLAAAGLDVDLVLGLVVLALTVCRPRSLTSLWMKRHPSAVWRHSLSPGGGVAAPTFQDKIPFASLGLSGTAGHPASARAAAAMLPAVPGVKPCTEKVRCVGVARFWGM